MLCNELYDSAGRDSEFIRVLFDGKSVLFCFSVYSFLCCVVFLFSFVLSFAFSIFLINFVTSIGIVLMDSRLFYLLAGFHQLFFPLLLFVTFLHLVLFHDYFLKVRKKLRTNLTFLPFSFVFIL